MVDSEDTPLLHILDIQAGYGKISVLHGVTLDVYLSEIVSIIGPNGAGKSTLFKAIFGFLTPHSGSVWFGKNDITALPPEKILKHEIAYVPQERTSFPDMTVEENLQMGMYVVGDRARVRPAMQRVFELFPRLAERRRQTVGTMSGGEQRMVEIARALMPEPRLLLIDEPSAGLAPVINKQVFATIRKLNMDYSTTILMIEQNARQALEISHRGYILEDGYNRFNGSSKSLLHNPEIQQMYLGGTAK
jgi:ABC-type branched-subunit amino acid transport system ATPase component